MAHPTRRVGGDPVRGGHAGRVAGKTGTAQNPHGEDHALFFGYAPAEEPEIVVVVVVEQSGHGGAVAAPVAQRVLAAYLDPTLKLLAARRER